LYKKDAYYVFGRFQHRYMDTHRIYSHKYTSYQTRLICVWIAST